MKLRNMLSKITKASKKTKAAVAIALAVTVPFFGMAQANTSLMEGHVKSLNVTAGETEYTNSTNAKVDEVVQVQLWHHNRENPAGEKVKNTVVKFDVPSNQGKKQVIKGTSSSDNGNTITDTTTVNLSLDNARVEYVPGTAKFRYNKGAANGKAECQTGFDFPPNSCYATVKVSDKVVNGGVNLDNIRGGPLTGCNAFHETVTIQVRVKADVVKVNKYVRHAGEGSKDWDTSTKAKPGDKLEYLIRFENKGNTTLKNVVVGDNLPKYNSYVNGTTTLLNGNYPDGLDIKNNNITKGGINVGSYLPGSAAYVWFTAKIDPVTAFEKCGKYDIRNVGVVRPEGMNEFYNTAQVIITVDDKFCEEEEEPEEPVVSCDLLELEKIGGRKVNVSVDTTATPSDRASVKHINYDFGDGETLMTDQTSVEHEYAEDGNYIVSAEVTFEVDGDEVKDTGDCVAEVSFETPPEQPEEEPKVEGKVTELPSTGAGSVAAVFTAVSAFGAGAHRFFTRRK